MNKQYLIIITFLFSLLACQKESKIYKTDSFGDTYKVSDFEIQDLTYEDRPYYRTSAYTLNTPELADKDGIALHVRNDDTTYHPVVLAQYMIKYTNSFYLTQNQEYINKA
ncbi:MAG: hypothetical protein K8R74_11685, partial [Bacteroidales bacterium]|nr:hypothetical protein [Bacteroidales bacterium]